jgi:hypothetical protein
MPEDGFVEVPEHTLFETLFILTVLQEQSLEMARYVAPVREALAEVVDSSAYLAYYALRKG